MQITKIAFGSWVMFMVAAVAIGCGGPVPQSSSATALPSPAAQATASEPTPVVAIGTLIPVVPNATPAATPTPAPTASPAPAPANTAGLSPTELKYRLLDKFPNFFYCDPDQFPVARVEPEVALGRFAEIQKDTEKFQTILKHTHLDGVANLSDAQKVIVYRDFKKLNALSLDLSAEPYRFKLRTQDSTTGKLSGTAVEGTITNQGNITITKSEPTVTTCPICLAANTRIDTPAGPVAVKDLREGMSVWSVDASGQRVSATIIATGHTLVPPTHQMAHLRLADGRELFASPGHPTADGRVVGDLQRGDMIDGAWVTSAERVAYADGATYDLLPSGDTGTYWANGILIGSTLR